MTKTNYDHDLTRNSIFIDFLVNFHEIFRVQSDQLLCTIIADTNNIKINKMNVGLECFRSWSLPCDCLKT